MIRSLVVLSALSLAVPVAAQSTGALPSCYIASKVGVAPLPPSRELFVLIDQTTQFDAQLKKTIGENVTRLLTPGTAFVVATFSGFAAGHYETVQVSGTLEATVAEALRDDVSTRGLERLDRCLADQGKYARQLVQKVLKSALEGKSQVLPRSDVMASLKEIAPRVAKSPARDRILFVASDMIENSSVASFYKDRNVRRIDPAKEMAVAESAGLIANFGGARVFVVGAGVLPPDADSKAIREVQAMSALEAFWTRWFKRSNAQVVAFGKPDLLVPVK